MSKGQNSEEQSNRSPVKRVWVNTNTLIVIMSFAMFGVIVLTIYVSVWAAGKLGGRHQKFEDKGRNHSFEEKGRNHSFEDKGRIHSFEDKDRHPRFVDQGTTHSFEDKGRNHSFEDMGRNHSFEDKSRHSRFVDQDTTHIFEDKGRNHSFEDKGKNHSFEDKGRIHSFEDKGRNHSFEDKDRHPLFVDQDTTHIFEYVYPADYEDGQMQLQASLERVPENAGAILPRGVESLLPPISPNFTAKDGTWQIVSGTRYKFFVFSAFYDRRENRSVRVIGATKTLHPERVWCRLWYNGSTSNGSASGASHSITVEAKVQMIRENRNRKYSACFILCPLGQNLSSPNSVSVVRPQMIAPANHILVRNTDQDPDLKDMSRGIPERLAICVKPLYSNYNQALRMLEFLELNAILGVQHFIIYNETSGPNVGCILQDYMSRGVVTLIPWELNMMWIHDGGTLAALNDCLYRTMYHYSHTALIDLDEYIVPRDNYTLPQLIKWMDTRSTGSYSLQSAFFYLQYSDDPSISQVDCLEGSLVTVRKTHRLHKLRPPKDRSKYICRPELVVEAGNHYVWDFIPGYGSLAVPPDAAFLHHYRLWEDWFLASIEEATDVDQITYRYRDRLVKRVRAKWNELQSQCKLPDLSHSFKQCQKEGQDQ